MIYLGVEYGVKFVLEGPFGARAVFNDSTDADYVGDLNPESSGLDAPEIREDSNDRVESDGAIFGDFFSGKRPVILQGTIIATSKAQRNERVGKLRAASNAKATNATLSWEDAAAGKVFVNLRRQQPLRITKGWTKEFQLSMVSSDSRILAYNLVTKSAKGITNSSQEKAPTVTGEIGSAAQWTNTANIKLSDNVYATANVGPAIAPRFVYGKTYGFTIPAGAQVIGVELKPEDKASVGAVTEAAEARISRNIASTTTIEEDGSIGRKLVSVSPNFASTLRTTSDVVQVIGLVTDLWEYTKYLTPTLINNANFGAAIDYSSSANSTVSLDYLPIKITYAEPIRVEPKNEGDVAGPALITIIGPLENFYVYNETTEEMLTYSGAVVAERSIVIDTENVTVVEKGLGITTPINRFGNVSIPNDWIKIAPGTNKLVLAGSGGSANTELKVEFRHAWE